MNAEHQPDAVADLEPVKKSKENPYISGRREWNAQFGRPIAEANWWRMVALISVVIALASLIGLLRLGAHTKVVPYVVVIDDLGRTVAKGQATANTGVDEKVRKSLLSNFIANVRSVTSDGAAQKERIQAAYSMLSASDPAFQNLNDWFTSPAGDPFERAKETTVSVQLSTFLPLSESTYQAEWRETIRSRSGKVLGVENYQGILSVTQTEFISDSQKVSNPIGLFIKEFTWTKRI